jgi:hypothetical protein
MSLAAAVAGGCDRRKPAAVAIPAPPASAPSTEPADTQPSVALIQVNGHSSVFPPARLRVERDGDHLAATLFSDDPREALKDNYAGNSFYLRMDLDISDPAAIEQTIWHYQAPSSSQRADSPYGIFLAGRKTQLQPYNVSARFRREASGAITVFLAGQFEVVDTSGGPGKMVPVAGELLTRVDRMPASKL